MLISLDYDDCFSADPDLWRQFIDLAKSRGHQVICCTARFETFENRQELKAEFPGPVYFANHNYKREVMEQAGRRVDVWIDDQPESIGERMKSPGAKIA